MKSDSKTDRAIDALHAALRQCADAGLAGGVYDSHFCVWPHEAGPPHEGPNDIFDNVVMSGGAVLNNSHGMRFKDGAGN